MNNIWTYSVLCIELLLKLEKDMKNDTFDV